MTDEVMLLDCKPGTGGCIEYIATGLAPYGCDLMNPHKPPAHFGRVVFHAAQ